MVASPIGRRELNALRPESKLSSFSRPAQSLAGLPPRPSYRSGLETHAERTRRAAAQRRSAQRLRSVCGVRRVFSEGHGVSACFLKTIPDAAGVHGAASLDARASGGVGSCERVRSVLPGSFCAATVQRGFRRKGMGAVSTRPLTIVNRHARRTHVRVSWAIWTVPAFRPSDSAQVGLGG